MKQPRKRENQWYKDSQSLNRFVIQNMVEKAIIFAPNLVRWW
jgi:hypothetical protein